LSGDRDMIIALKKYNRIIADEADDRLTVPHFLFLLSWLLKPFYLWESGTIQISDFVFILSFFAWVITRSGWILVDKRELPLLGFIVGTLIINGIYAAALRNAGFLISTAYYVYNFLVVIVMRDFLKNRTFLKALLLASILNLLVQLAILMMGKGSHLWGIYRFMGTFNDPNQFAFLMFTSFLVVYILSSYFKNFEMNRKKLLVLISFGLAFFFIFQGGSTGMLLGITSFLVMFVITFINSERTPVFMLLKALAIMLLVAAMIIAIATGFTATGIDSSVESNTFLISRLFQKMEKVEDGGMMAIIEERHIDNLINYPVYLIFGAGEGAHERFSSGYEVHSTLPALLFYYGLIPLIFLGIWLRLNLKGINKILLPAYLALLFESFTLANQRQPILWVIIVLGSLEYYNANKLRNYHIMANL